MIGALDDPYSLYLTSRRVQGACARGSVGRVRGHRGDDRHGRRRRRHLDLHRPRRRTAGWSSSPRSRARRPRRPGCVAGDVIDGHRRRAGSRASPSTPRATGSAGAKDTAVDAVDRARRRGAVRRRDRAGGDHHSPRSRPRTSPGRRSATSSCRASPTTPPTQFDEARRRRRRGAASTKLILDLRGNPGGFVTAARDIASQFLADGPIFWQEDADGSLVETVAKPGGAATDPSIELVVLVDGGSASASEIVAGALHDRGRATLVGDEDVRQGHGPAVDPARGRPAAASGSRPPSWLTPDRTWIHGKGIEPDVVVTDGTRHARRRPGPRCGARGLGARRREPLRERACPRVLRFDACTDCVDRVGSFANERR